MVKDEYIKLMNPHGDIVERIVVGGVPLEVYLWHIGRYLFALDFIDPDDTVLDIACGVGYGSYLLAKKAQKVIGIDISEDAINYAKDRYSRKAGNIEFYVGDATNIPIASSKIDVLVSFETIEHLENPDAFLIEARRVLREQGLLILSTPNKYVALKKNVKNPYHISELFIEEIINKLSSLGFEIKNVYGQRPNKINVSGKEFITYFIMRIVSKLMPSYIKQKMHLPYISLETWIPKKIIELYNSDPEKFEEWIINNGIHNKYLPRLIRDLEANKYMFDVFVIVAQRD